MRRSRRSCAPIPLAKPPIAPEPPAQASLFGDPEGAHDAGSKVAFPLEAGVRGDALFAGPNSEYRVWTPRWMQEVFEGVLRGFRCFRVSGLLMQPSSRLLACMEIADRIQIAFARSRRPDISLVFPTPSADRCAIPHC